jgi:hypothetical protein
MASAGCWPTCDGRLFELLAPKRPVRMRNRRVGCREARRTFATVDMTKRYCLLMYNNHIETSKH